MVCHARGTRTGSNRGRPVEKQPERRTFAPGHAKAKGLSEHMGNSGRQLGRVQKTQPEPAPPHPYTSSLGPNRNNAKVLIRNTNRLGCSGEHHHLKESIPRAPRGQTREPGEARAWRSLCWPGEAGETRVTQKEAETCWG